MEVASGIDALYVSGHGTVSPSLLRALPAHRSAAEELGEPVPIDFGDGGWVVEPRGWLLYRYSLRHEHSRLGITDKLSIPALRFQPLSEFLHAVGPAEALVWIQQQADEAAPKARLTGTRLDVYADWQGWPLGRDDLDRFVRRASAYKIHGSRADWTGFDFGRRKSGTVVARIYDKTRQVSDEGKDWWYGVWADRYDGKTPVLRLEFEVGRQGLKEFGLDAATDVLAGGPGIWAALTDKWLTLRTPSDDHTRSRWPLAPEWEQVQAASFRANAIGLDRIRKGRNAGSLRTMTPGLVGYLAKAGALLGTQTLEDTLELLHEHVWAYGDRRGVTFEDRLRDKARGLAA